VRGVEDKYHALKIQKPDGKAEHERLKFNLHFAALKSRAVRLPYIPKSERV
jgi:hypothetical protein